MDIYFDILYYITLMMTDTGNASDCRLSKVFITHINDLLILGVPYYKHCRLGCASMKCIKVTQNLYENLKKYLSSKPIRMSGFRKTIQCVKKDFCAFYIYCCPILPFWTIQLHMPVKVYIECEVLS